VSEGLDEFSQEAQDADLRATIRRLQGRLSKAEATREEMVAAVYQAAKDAASGMVIPAIPRPAASAKGKDPEVAIAMLADWQLGKRTPSYDSEVCKERVRRYAAKVVRLIDLQRAHHPVDEARVYLLGDLVEGEEIFPGQAHRIDASLYTQLFDCAQLIAEAVRTIAASVDRVKVVGVIGNHGALGGPIRKSYHPETNADAMAYNVARMLVKGGDGSQEPRIEWLETFVMGESSWYGTDDVLGNKWFMFHGNQAGKGAPLGIPWYGFYKRLLGWSHSVAPFRFSASGHWHQSVRMQVNDITHWGAGSTESGNTFAQEYLASGGQEPSQPLVFMNADGVTAEYQVRVR
jgi:hypothetical protein